MGQRQQSLTQQQQLELPARIPLVPTQLPLDLGADALRLLLLRGQTAAAGHGAPHPTGGAVRQSPVLHPAARYADPRRTPGVAGKRLQF